MEGLLSRIGKRVVEYGSCVFNVDLMANERQVKRQRDFAHVEQIERIAETLVVTMIEIQDRDARKYHRADGQRRLVNGFGEA